MLRIEPIIGRTCLVFLVSSSCANPGPDRMGEYRRADFGPIDRLPPMDDRYRNRIALEFEIVRSGQLEPIRAGLLDQNPYVRAFSASAVGILGDSESASTISQMLDDPEGVVRVGALQAMGWLKLGLQVVPKPRALYRHLVDIAARQIEDPIDHAAAVRRDYRLGLKREEIGSARIGQPAPDFSARDARGGLLRLSDEVPKYRAVLLVFVSADW